MAGIGVQETKCENLVCKHSKLKEKYAELKAVVPDIETSLHAARGETARLAGALEEQQSSSKRRERQLSSELKLATQVSVTCSIFACSGVLTVVKEFCQGDAHLKRPCLAYALPRIAFRPGSSRCSRFVTEQVQVFGPLFLQHHV